MEQKIKTRPTDSGLLYYTGTENQNTTNRQRFTVLHWNRKSKHDQQTAVYCITLVPTEPLHSPGGVDTSCLGGRMYTRLVDGVSEDLPSLCTVLEESTLAALVDGCIHDLSIESRKTSLK